MRRILFFVAGCALLGVLLWLAGAGDVGQALVLLGFSGVVIIATLHLPLLVLLGLAWRVVSENAALASTFIAVRLIRESAAELLPFSQLGGFAVAIRAIGLKGVPALPAALSLFADLLAEFAAKLPYALAGIAALTWLKSGAGRYFPLLMCVAASAVVIALAIRFRAALSARLENAARSLLRRWVRYDLSTGEIAEMYRRKRILPCFLLHVVCWFLGAIETGVIFALIHNPVTPVQALVIDSLAGMLRTFAFFIPAAAGAQEGIYVAICGMFGIAPAAALALSLARRARELVLGVPGLLLWQAWEAKSANR